MFDLKVISCGVNFVDLNLLPLHFSWTGDKVKNTGELLTISLWTCSMSVFSWFERGKKNNCLRSAEQVIKAAEDCARQYMNFMNVIFAAQKQVLFMCVCLLYAHMMTVTPTLLYFATEHSNRRLCFGLGLRSPSAGALLPCSCPKVLELEGFRVVVAALTVSSAALATLVLGSSGLHVPSSDVRFCRPAI